LIHELTNVLDVETPLGRGWAIILEASTQEYYWTVVLKDTRAIVTFRQKEIRLARNYTLGIDFPHDKMKDLLG
jgi:hypothetical protein